MSILGIVDSLFATWKNADHNKRMQMINTATVIGNSITQGIKQAQYNKNNVSADPLKDKIKRIVFQSVFVMSVDKCYSRDLGKTTVFTGTVQVGRVNIGDILIVDYGDGKYNEVKVKKYGTINSDENYVQIDVIGKVDFGKISQLSTLCHEKALTEEYQNWYFGNDENTSYK